MMAIVRRWFISGSFALIVLLLAMGGGAWLHYRYVEDRFQAILEAENERLREEKEALQQMIDRLSRTHRMAQIVVVDQTRRTEAIAEDEADARIDRTSPQPDRRGRASDEDDDTDDGARGANRPATFGSLLGRATGDADVIETTLLFAEVDEEGRTLSREYITIPGNVAFFDGLVVKFDMESVAKGHPLRGRSIALLRRVYSERQAPSEGFLLDDPNRPPAGYRLADAREGVEKSENDLSAEARREMEMRVWSQFWNIANDPQRAEELGVRVAQGEAVYKPMKPGVLYELTIDAAGGLNLETKPLPEAVADVLAAAGGGRDH